MRTTQSALSVASKQVQTGYRVSDAQDDASTFSVAQGIRGNLQAFSAVQGSLANGVGLGTVTQAALTNISNLVGNLQAKITQLADGSIGNSQRTIYAADFSAMTNQISNFIAQASYNGVNLLSNNSAAKTFLADTSATTLTMTSQSSVHTAFTTFAASTVRVSVTAATAALTSLTTFANSVASSLGANAADTRSMTSAVELRELGGRCHDDRPRRHRRRRYRQGLGFGAVAAGSPAAGHPVAVDRQPAAGGAVGPVPLIPAQQYRTKVFRTFCGRKADAGGDSRVFFFWGRSYPMAGSINSLNTNEGAYRALSSTRSQSAALQQAQKRLQTGLRVADAADDASTFAVAQGLRGDLQSFTAVQSSLSNGAGLGSVTQAALGQVSDLSNQLQQRLTQLSDGSISTQQRATYAADVQSLTSQIQSTIQQAGFNGQNLLQTGASGHVVPGRYEWLQHLGRRPGPSRRRRHHAARCDQHVECGDVASEPRRVAEFPKYRRASGGQQRRRYAWPRPAIAISPTRFPMR